jgi:hypothetical protein
VRSLAAPETPNQFTFFDGLGQKTGSFGAHHFFIITAIGSCAKKGSIGLKVVVEDS